MKRVLAVAAALAVLAFLASRHPAAAPALTSLAPPDRVPHNNRRAYAAPASRVVVYVVGAVVRPGLYRLADGSRAEDAVRQAGGLTPDADPAAVNLAERVSDGEEIDALRAGESSTARGRSRTTTRRRTRTRRRRSGPVAQLDLNSADAQALESLPGVGETLAQRIVEFRQVNGSFASVDELADVAGMTQSRVDALAPYLRVSATP